MIRIEKNTEERGIWRRRKRKRESESVNENENKVWSERRR